MLCPKFPSVRRRAVHVSSAECLLMEPVGLPAQNSQFGDTPRQELSLQCRRETNAVMLKSPCNSISPNHGVHVLGCCMFWVKLCKAPQLCGNLKFELLNSFETVDI